VIYHLGLQIIFRFLSFSNPFGEHLLQNSTADAVTALLSTSPPTTTMSDLRTFHKFSELPLEIRGQIWAIALNSSAPRGYYVDIYIPHDAQQRQAGLRHVHSGYFLANWSKVSGKHCRATDLEAVSHEVRTEVAHGWKAFKPEVPFTLEGFGNGCNPSTIHGETGGPSGESCIVVDAENDIFIIEEWDTYAKALAVLRPDLDDREDPPEDPYKGLEAIKQICIPYTAGFWDNKTFRSIIMQALVVFPNLRTLFIHIEPEDPWTMYKRLAPLGDIGQLDRHAAPPWYFGAKDPQEEVPFLTHTQDRTYYELSPERVLADVENGGLFWGGFRWFIENPQDVEVKFLSWYFGNKSSKVW
jgi:hypothetical protein